MFGSASTWTFNVVQKLAAAMRPDQPIRAGLIYDSLDAGDSDAVSLVVKTHFTPIAEQLAAQAEAIIVTIRDPRDAVASSMVHLKMSFPIALAGTIESAALCARLAGHPRTTLLRFEDRFFDQPATIAGLAACFPGTLAAADFERIVAETRRPAIDRFIAEMQSGPGVASTFDPVTGTLDVYDPVTQWRSHHAGRQAEIGRWRRDLSPAEVLEVERVMAGWMERFGYGAAARPASGAESRPGRGPWTPAADASAA
jgi:hypothetical protein